MIFQNVQAFRNAGFRPKVCIIGSGPAGTTIARKLGAAGIPTVVFEAGSDEWTEEFAGFLSWHHDRRSLFRSGRHPVEISRRFLKPLGRLVPHDGRPRLRRKTLGA